MPSGDVLMILQWWFAWLTLGLVGWPITKVVFKTWDTRGYVFAKVIGASIVAYLVWVFGTLHLAKFNINTILVVSVIWVVISWLIINKFSAKDNLKINWKAIVIEEIVFLAMLGFWAWVRGHSPDIRDLEKFMDYGFAQAISKGEYFPPKDMWFAGESINYYYFGHLIMSLVAKLSRINLDVGFNLMLATIFSFCLTLSWAIGRRLLSRSRRFVQVFGGLFTALLLTFGGNLHTIYAFTSGYKYDSENPTPFWQILINPLDQSQREAGWTAYWYPNATRFIPYTIHEFPSYSFVVSDIHGHVLSIPLALLAIALIFNYFVLGSRVNKLEAMVFGIVAGWLFTTNALDGPIYLTIFSALLIVKNVQIPSTKSQIISKFKIINIKKLLISLAIVAGTFVVTILPFAHHFKSFVSGVGINCPPAALAYKPIDENDDGVRKVGPLVFGTTQKCQRSPAWMLFILWGFFAICGFKFVRSNQNWGEKKSLIIILLCCTGLILFAEVFYFKDIYPQHFRSNTMFKLGYQAFMILSLISGTTIITALGKLKKNLLFLICVIPMVYLVLLYPFFSVKSYFGELLPDNYKGLNGLGWINEAYPDDLQAIYWLRENTLRTQVNILESAGDSYTDYARFSTFTGLPTIAGWTVHEWLWRGDYGPIANRNEEVRQVYEATSTEEAKKILDKYNIKYLVIGQLERKKYLNINETILMSLGTEVFTSPTTKIIQVNPR